MSFFDTVVKTKDSPLQEEETRSQTIGSLMKENFPPALYSLVKRGAEKVHEQRTQKGTCEFDKVDAIIDSLLIDAIIDSLLREHLPPELHDEIGGTTERHFANDGRAAGAHAMLLHMPRRICTTEKGAFHCTAHNYKVDIEYSIKVNPYGNLCGYIDLPAALNPVNEGPPLKIHPYLLNADNSYGYSPCEYTFNDPPIWSGNSYYCSGKQTKSEYLARWGFDTSHWSGEDVSLFGGSDSGTYKTKKYVRALLEICVREFVRYIIENQNPTVEAVRARYGDAVFIECAGEPLPEVAYDPSGLRTEHKFVGKVSQKTVFKLIDNLLEEGQLITIESPTAKGFSIVSRKKSEQDKQSHQPEVPPTAAAATFWSKFPKKQLHQTEIPVSPTAASAITAPATDDEGEPVQQQNKSYLDALLKRN